MATEAEHDAAGIIDHVGVGVSDYARSRAFYDAALAPLGIRIMMEHNTGAGTRHAGYGRDGRPQLWIASGQVSRGHVHVALRAPDRAAVDAFHAAAIAAGGQDHGAPGLRPAYHADYYGAFVFDPDGHNVEAVTHLVE